MKYIQSCLPPNTVFLIPSCDGNINRDKTSKNKPHTYIHTYIHTTLLHSVVYDITERKLAEEKLRVSEEKYRSLVESINDVIYEVSMLGEIKYVSPSVVRVLGFTANEVIGTNLISYIHTEDRELIGNRLSSLQEKDYTYLEYRYINKSGEICWVRSSTTAVIVNGK